jgi:hypothetical protein
MLDKRAEQPRIGLPDGEIPIEQNVNATHAQVSV